MYTRIPRRIKAPLLIVALPVGLGLTFTGVQSAAADPFQYEFLAGVPSAGAVQDRLASGGTQLLDEDQLGLGPNGKTDRFGTTVLATDLNGDGYPDLVVGVPATVGASGTGRPGRVDVVFGSSKGISAAGEYELSAPAVSGDEFGDALAIGGGYLWVGAPDRTVDGKADAGAVMRYKLGSDGRASYADTVTQNSSLVPGAAETGDHFGAVLAGAPNGAVVGVPDESIGPLAGAGEIMHLRVGSAGTLLKATDWSQNSTGVPGVAEAGDHFGASLTRNGAAVGVPGEDVGSLKDAGSIQTFAYNSKTGQLTPSAAFTQDSKGIPGVAEAGDQFGAAVAEGVFRCQEDGSVAVGSPGEDVGNVSNAGSVTLIPLPAYAADHLCPSKAITQGSSFPGKSEAGDHFGAAVGVIPGDPNLEEDSFDTLLIGDPGENIGQYINTGRVFVVNRTKPADSLSEHYAGGDRTGLGFGSVLLP